MRPPRVVVVGDLAVDVLVAPRSSAVASGPVPLRGGGAQGARNERPSTGGAERHHKGPASPPERSGGEIIAGADVPARIRTRAGGAGANTAAWLAHLGAEVTLVARVGDDPAGRAAAADLQAAGVRPALTVDPAHPTCTVVVLLTDGDRTMLSDRGAAARLAPADLPAFDGTDHLHLSGYVLLDPASRAAGQVALRQAKAAGLSTSVDPQVAPALGPEFVDDVRGVDLLLPNAAELAALGGVAALQEVAGAVVATDGPRAARWTDRHGTWTVRPPRTKVVDPTGAGDAFDAGLLVAWLSGSDPSAALEAGCAAGAAAVGQLGARPQQPSAAASS